MPNNFEMNKVLYYPTIEFQSETWVKAALLFWDKIYRIVPSNYTPNDPVEIKEAIEGNFIVNVNMNSHDLDQAADSFINYCDELEWLPSGFGDSQFEVKLHNDKVDERLKLFFKDFKRKLDSKGFYHLPAEIVSAYMFFLSDTISRRRHIPKLTDDSDMFTAMSFFDNEGLFKQLLTDESSEEIYTNLIIENLIPADIKSIKMETILNLSSTLRKSKDDFRVIVSGFSERIKNIKDKEFVIKEIQEFKVKLSDNKMTRQEYLMSFTNNLAPSMLYTGLPVFATSLLGSLFQTKSDIFEIIEIVRGLAVAGVAALRDAAGRVRNDWNPYYSNYYMEIKNHLTSEQASSIGYRNFSYKLEEYLYD